MKRRDPGELLLVVLSVATTILLIGLTVWGWVA